MDIRLSCKIIIVDIGSEFLYLLTESPLTSSISFGNRSGCPHSEFLQEQRRVETTETIQRDSHLFGSSRSEVRGFQALVDKYRKAVKILMNSCVVGWIKPNLFNQFFKDY